MRNLALFSAAALFVLSSALAPPAQADDPPRGPDDFRIETPLATVSPGHEFVVRVFEGNSASLGGRATVRYQNEAGLTVLESSATFAPGQSAFFSAPRGAFNLGLRLTSARAVVEVILNDEKAETYISFEYVNTATESAAPGGWSCAVPAGPNVGTAVDDPDRLETDPEGPLAQAALAPRQGQLATEVSPRLPRCGGGGAGAVVFAMGS